MTAATTALSNAPSVDTDEILDGILEWVEMETPTLETDAVNKLADKVEEQYAGLGLTIERTPGRDGFGDLIRARTDPEDTRPGILVLCHIDTVHPLGTKAEDLVVRREGDKMYGPGIYDMKAGAYLPYYAYRHMQRLGATSQLPITFLYVSEEAAAPARIEAEGQGQIRAGHRTRPRRRQGRHHPKGVGRFEMAITGRPSHGAQHPAGRSASARWPARSSRSKP